MKLSRILSTLFLALTLTALAEDSCTNWMKQADGSLWRTCVDDHGNQYCQQSVNGQISRVDCKKK